MKYIYYQPNQKDIGDKVGDCAIRALCKALNKSWIDIFDDLCGYARKIQCLPNQKPAYESYLNDIGWKYVTLGKKRQKVANFKPHEKGFYILYVRVGYRTHMVAADKQFYYDTWDCGNKLIYGYFTKT